MTAILGRRRGAGAGVGAALGSLERTVETADRRSTRGRSPRPCAMPCLSSDGELCANGCAALLSIREFELIPALVTAIEEPNNPYATMVAETLIALCEMLQEEISGPRQKQRLREPARVCQQVLPSSGAGRRSLRAASSSGSGGSFSDADQSRECPAQTRPLRTASSRLSGGHGDSGNSSARRHHAPGAEPVGVPVSHPSIALQVVSHRRDLVFIRQLAPAATGQYARRTACCCSLRRVESISGCKVI